jgi:putative membrane protein
MATDAVKLDSTALALNRTQMALERTLMAWVRTSASMISFGFSVYKFFQFEQKDAPGRVQGMIFTPRAFAIILVSIGLVSLLAATAGHRRQAKILTGKTTGGFSLAELVAGLISLFGIAALVAAILRQ